LSQQKAFTKCHAAIFIPSLSIACKVVIVIPGMNPKQMQAMMRQFGIKSEEVRAKRVVIETDNGNLVVSDPQVIAVEMQGEKMFQISGRVQEEGKKDEEGGKGFSEDDLKLVMQEAKCSREDAEKALEETKGNLAEAILKIQEEKKA
jgi:nascent polypeptide-associated complex subunit alpha